VVPAVAVMAGDSLLITVAAAAWVTAKAESRVISIATVRKMLKNLFISELL
jgi:hypothetical protein